MSESKLKPCPFCGCDRISTPYSLAGNAWSECQGCGVRGPWIHLPFGTDPDALIAAATAAWNHRAEPAPGTTEQEGKDADEQNRN